MNPGPFEFTEIERRPGRRWPAWIAACALGIACSKSGDGSGQAQPKAPSRVDQHVPVQQTAGPADKRAELLRLETSAKSGNYTNQFKLGMMYVEGKDVEQDDFAARKWLTLAAEQGYATAQWRLGLRLVDSKSIIHDNERAVHWFRRAADQDVADAQYQLGVMYHQGRVPGERRDFVKAAQWLTRAADKGHPPAMLLLGQMHAVGEGTTRNLAEAARRYEQAAIRGNVLAQRLLAQLHYQGIDGAPNLATGARWLKSAADAGDLVAMQDFAMRLAFGEGTDHNLTEAYRYLLLASKHPDAEVVGIQNILTRLRRVEQSLTQQQIDEVNRVVNEAMKNSAKPMAGP